MELNSCLVCPQNSAKNLVLQWQIQGRGPGGPPTYFLPQLRPKEPKNFVLRPAPPYLRNWMTTPLPPYLKVWISHCSGRPLVYRDLSAHHDWPVQKATVNLLSRVKRKSKCICGNSLSLLEAQNEDLLVRFCRCYLPGLDCNVCHVDS